MQTIDFPMQRYSEKEEVDYVIVGVGAAGGVLLQRLARAGFKVVGMEAGPFWDTERDWVSDEAGSHQLYWEDMRVTGGKNPLALGANNCGKGVGGGSVHWAAFTPRFHPSDFEVYTRDGVGADWPISYWDLKPYYEFWNWRCPWPARLGILGAIRTAMPLARIPMGGVGNTLIRGCTKLGIGVSAGGPVAILERFARQPAALHLPGLLHPGLQGGRKGQHADHARSRCLGKRRGNSRPLHGLANSSRSEKATASPESATSNQEGNEHFQKAKAVIVSGYAIETPRLLLNSACDGYENGLANSSGTVGRYLMAQAGNVILGPLRRAGADVQGAARPRADGGIL